jgi:hypothetical protein
MGTDEIAAISMTSANESIFKLTYLLGIIQGRANF